MAKKDKAPAVVAELGRPETAAETAARKAKDSHLYRSRKTVNNLVFSLIVSLGVMLLIVLMAPGLTGGKNVFEEQSVNVAELAKAAEPTAGRPLIAPDPGEGWLAKHADLRTAGDVISWHINYTTADKAYASVVQGFTANGAPVSNEWVSAQLEDQKPTGSETLGGVEWIVYDHTDRSPDGANMLFGLQGEIDGNTVLVFGTDSPATIRVLATQVAESFTSTAP